jgi:hypothetical protein
MPNHIALCRLYLANAAFLIAHEIDSAYWHEWDLFGLAGGIGAFVLLHVPLAAAVLWGFGALRTGARSGLWMSVLLATVGLSAGAIHGAFLLSGRPEFRTPVSIGVIAVTALLSLIQMWTAARALRRRAEGGADASSETPSIPAL